LHKRSKKTLANRGRPHMTKPLDGIFWIYRLYRLKRDRVVKRFDKAQRTQASGD